MFLKLANNFKKIRPWFIAYAGQSASRMFRHDGGNKPTHIFVCICDHFEPLWRKADEDTGWNRINGWYERYPLIADKYRDADGCVPKYTFFYPIEEYRPEYMNLLADLHRRGYGEVEIHLHHDNDNADNLRRTLLDFKKMLVEEYGLLCRDKDNKEIRYGFIHGNWALDNSRKDGRRCGVNNELEVLVETGCYADFTMPSAPDETQTATINSIYYAVDNPNKPNSHNRGISAKTGESKRDGLLMVQGPLMLNWQNRKFGFFPRVENSELSHDSVITPERIRLWRGADIHVAGKPEYVFIKLHTHGCQENNARYLLDGGLDNLFSCLRDSYNDGDNYLTHYVSSREMVNVIKSVEDSFVPLDINELRDYRLVRV